jgi:hypothetical protein
MRQCSINPTSANLPRSYRGAVTAARFRNDSTPIARSY